MYSSAMRAATAAGRLRSLKRYGRESGACLGNVTYRWGRSGMTYCVGSCSARAASSFGDGFFGASPPAGVGSSLQRAVFSLSSDVGALFVGTLDTAAPQSGAGVALLNRAREAGAQCIQVN